MKEGPDEILISHLDGGMDIVLVLVFVLERIDIIVSKVGQGKDIIKYSEANLALEVTIVFDERFSGWWSTTIVS